MKAVQSWLLSTRKLVRSEKLIFENKLLLFSFEKVIEYKFKIQNEIKKLDLLKYTSYNELKKLKFNISNTNHIY